MSHSHNIAVLMIAFIDVAEQAERRLFIYHNDTSALMLYILQAVP